MKKELHIEQEGNNTNYTPKNWHQEKVNETDIAEFLLGCLSRITTNCKQTFRCIFLAVFWFAIELSMVIAVIAPLLMVFGLAWQNAVLASVMLTLFMPVFHRGE